MREVSWEERHRRWSNIRSELEKEDLEALIVVSDGHIERRGSFRYVSGINTTLRYAYAIIPRKGEPVALYTKDGWIKDRRALPIRGGWVVESEPYGRYVVDVLKELDIHKGRIGIEGDFLPAPVYEILKAGLPGATFVASEIIHRLKMVKSEEELKLIEDGVDIVDKTFDHCVQFACAGMTWNDITSEACKMLYELGVEDIGGYPLSRSTRFITESDFYNFYPEVQAPGGYWIQFGRLISFGEPKKEWQLAWEINIKALEYGEEALKPGNTGADVMRAINKALEGTNYAGAARGSGHGVGLDVIERPFITLDDETILKPGMVVALHPIMTPANPVFEACADLYVVTEGKPRRLSKIGREIVIIKRR